MDLHKPIGILGGTFDPIHLGHLKLGFEVLKKTPIQIIKILPCYQPVHRNEPKASSQQRVAMIQKAISEYPQFELDEREITRKGPSFMIDTLESLRKEFPNTPLCLIVGQDAFSQLPTWKKWRELLLFAHIVIANRPDSELIYHQDLNDVFQQHLIQDANILAQKLFGAILPMVIKPIAISATEIRAKVNAHQSIADLVPKEVANYIHTHHLYS